MSHALAFFQRPKGAAPLIIGHRGTSAPMPENTIGAFEQALAQGAQAIELDVLQCASGEPVVHHDPTLERLTGGADSRAISSLCYQDLRRVDLGQGQRVPLLTEALALARERGAGVNVELKRETPDRRALIGAVARLVRTWDTSHPILVSSFDPAMLAAFRLAAPRIPLAYLIHRTWWTRYALTLPGSLGARVVHIERVIAQPELVRQLKSKGYIVNVWTVNSATEARDLSELGVDGIISDLPGQIKEAFSIRRIGDA